jgi:hypothetical protein
MMDRRDFLHGLFGATAIAAVPSAIHVLAPPGGWRRDGSLYTLYGGTRGGGKSEVRRALAAAYDVPERYLFTLTDVRLVSPDQRRTISVPGAWRTYVNR